MATEPNWGFAHHMNLRPGKTYNEQEVFDILNYLATENGAILMMCKDNKIADYITIMECLRGFKVPDRPRVEFKFSNREAYKKGKGEINLPVHVVNLSSLVGVAISCLTGGVELNHVLPELDFYARFFRCFKETPEKLAISTIFVGFNGRAAPFWFGSSIAGGIGGADRPGDTRARRKILSDALYQYKERMTLPLIPPLRQMTIGENICTELRWVGLPDQAKRAKVITQLVQLIVQAKSPAASPPWAVASQEPPGFKDNAEAICREAGEGIVCPPGLFGKLSKSVNDTRRGASISQEYGHCAETYPLIFMMKKEYERKNACKDLGTKPEHGEFSYQGLARSVSGREGCTEFYAGGAGRAEKIECYGTGDCKMKCGDYDENGISRGTCKLVCKGNEGDYCMGWDGCDTVCRQSEDCRTRCYGGAKCQETPLAPCRKRSARCAECRLGNWCPQCWRYICQRCMDPELCCASCIGETCLRCDFIAPCENCWALIRELGYGETWNIVRQGVGVEPQKSSPYVIWKGWDGEAAEDWSEAVPSTSRGRSPKRPRMEPRDE